MPEPDNAAPMVAPLGEALDLDDLLDADGFIVGSPETGDAS